MPEDQRVKQLYLLSAESKTAPPVSLMDQPLVHASLIPVATLVAIETRQCTLLFPALERIIKCKETAHSLILRFLEAGLPFRTEVEVRASG